MIEDRYDIAFVANLARREKQIQQIYRPVIAVHKWFARRPGTLFRALMLAEFSDLSLQDAFYQAANLSGKTIADPFMGGGTPLLEANRMGAHVQGCDINPMAYWIVRQEMEYLNLQDYSAAASKLRKTLESELGHLYRTRCEVCGNPEAHVKYFLWVKVVDCHHCGNSLDLFPDYLVAEDARHPKKVLVCSECGQLTETSDRKKPGYCTNCQAPLPTVGSAKSNRCHCSRCGEKTKYPNGTKTPIRHRLFAIEYQCPNCKPKRQGRFFKASDTDDLAKVAEAENRLAALSPQYIPDDAIPAGDETTRLHRWGYSRYRELFNARQLIGLETSCRLIAAQKDERIRNALATNLSDLLRYQNMLCRYDTMTLKSLDIFSVHGFPVGLTQCESNLLGIENGGSFPTGSGGWLNIIEKFTKAKAYCDKPFEVRHQGTAKGGRKVTVPISGEWIGDSRNGVAKRALDIVCADAANWDWRPESLDGVFTDPPYFGNVQYAELMDFCYVWLRRLVGKGNPAFSTSSTRHAQELTGNENMRRGLAHFTEGLAEVFSRTAAALKPGGPFVFTYHHNDITAYFPIAVAILDAGLVCSKVLPCPAEMGASIHIKGTMSSTVDSVFVCRRRQDRGIPEPDVIDNAIQVDMRALETGGLNATLGDTRCVTYGHIIRQAINDLAGDWQTRVSVKDKLDILVRWFATFGGQAVARELTGENCSRESQSLFSDQTFPPIAIKRSVHEPVSV
ncbi:MAG: DNA methylase [Deltaproteobacteria bacterium]|jgi:adenine-specific DNA methylase|nr:DNA methylase [Deltaproteobacteria bacterium]